MIWTLIKKEMHVQILSVRFTVSLILALLFLICSTYMLAGDSSWVQRQVSTGFKLKKGFYTNGYSWAYVNGTDLSILL